MLVFRCVSALLAWIGLVYPAATQSLTADKQRDGVVRLKSGDAAMAEAIRKARSGLNDFLALAENPRPETRDFSVKVGIPVGNNVEYPWVRPFSREGGGFKGRLINDVAIMPGLKYGQMIEFDKDNIVDWSYREGDRLVGNLTACALAQKLPPEERQAFVKKYGLDCRN